MRLALALALALALPAPAHADTRYIASKRVTATFYLPTGNRMYNGEWPRLGSAACDWSIPLGTVVLFHDARVVRCEDRGHLGSAGWIDIFCQDTHCGHEVATAYPERVTVSLFLP